MENETFANNNYMQQSSNQFQYLFDMEIKKDTVSLQTKANDNNCFCQNSLVLVQYPDNDQKNYDTLYVPAYVRTHIRNMKHMDTGNLTSILIATLNIDFYLGKFQNKREKEIEKEIAFNFANCIHKLLLKSLKIIFRNDVAVCMDDDMATNISKCDRFIRADIVQYKVGEITYIYSHFEVTRDCQFRLSCDPQLFPLQINKLDMDIKLNEIKTKYTKQNGTQKKLCIRFNCMSLQINGALSKQIDKLDQKQITEQIQKIKNQNQIMINKLQDFYQLQNKNKNGAGQLSNSLKQKKQKLAFYRKPFFFKYILTSFPKTRTEFGQYKIVQKDIEYTITNQMPSEKQGLNYLKILLKSFLAGSNELDKNQQQSQLNSISQSSRQSLHQEQQKSFCNVLLRIPLIKVSVGTVLQLFVPIFFLCLLSFVQFLYSAMTSIDLVRGLKITTTTLIVAAYLSLIYAMRDAIPPSPKWSAFEVYLCYLVLASIFPMIQVFYQDNIKDTTSPLSSSNKFFEATFVINITTFTTIIFLGIFSLIYKNTQTRWRKLNHVTMDDMLEVLTKENFYLWRNRKCKEFMVQKINGLMRKVKSTQKKENKLNIRSDWLQTQFLHVNSSIKIRQRKQINNQLDLIYD